MATIRALGVEDAAAYVALRRSALELEPHAFASSPEDDAGLTIDGARTRLGPARVAAGAVTFGAFAPGLVGMTTVHREEQRKLRHKAWIFGVFVAPGHRRRGLADALMRRAIEHARALEGVELLQLGVTSSADAAIALYERFGFVRFGREPRALKVDGAYYDEILMQLRLDAEPSR